MPHSGSAFSTSSNTFCDARYQNECWYSIPRSNSFCASGLHDVSKCTVPSFLSSDCPNAGSVNESPTTVVTASTKDVLTMIQILVGGMILLSAPALVAMKSAIRPRARR